MKEEEERAKKEKEEADRKSKEVNIKPGRRRRRQIGKARR